MAGSAGIDFSQFKLADVRNIALQRTSQLLCMPGLGRLSYTIWKNGISAPLSIEAALRRAAILRGAYAEIEAEFHEMLPAIRQPPKTIVDIGCGHALIDLLFAKRFGSEIWLIDIEQTQERHHNFSKRGSGYASLASAKAFLVSNGVSASQIHLVNPQFDSLPAIETDLAISLLSCGFHYPLTTYEKFLRSSIPRGGQFICDVRAGTGQESLEGFEMGTPIHETSKKCRMAFVRVDDL